ncbi:hypothetical protein DM01DRAFT_267611 [Hesseltinella vesiculosa]|uniref:Uncharacterized protein n=1 Tax=Hesseltinella vesiculosa TaxID=101127 RepID=A0A1X2GHW9_9FUNG|nr:hypothetical protein DM01DRAFT_267611 [Hesseltinella vesiculosa]
MFFCEKYTEDNVEKLTKKIEKVKDIDICYLNDPVQPFMCSILAIKSNPSKYHLYPTQVEIKD